MLPCDGTYTVDGYSLSINADCNLGALPLLCAAGTAHSSSMHASAARTYGLGQRRQREGGTNWLVERHVVCQTFPQNNLRSA